MRRSRLMKVAGLLLGIGLVFGMTAISEAKKPNPAEENIVTIQSPSPSPWEMTVTPTSLTICVGKSGTVTATISPSDPTHWFEFAPTGDVKDAEGNLIAIVDVKNGEAKITAVAPGTFTLDVKGHSPVSGEHFGPVSVSITLYEVKHATRSPTPANRERTTIGLGEEVFFWTEPGISAKWSADKGQVSPEEGLFTVFTAPKSPSTPTVHAKVDDIDCTVSFDVIPPSGMLVSRALDIPIGTPGPPNNSIGAMTWFLMRVQPERVSFYNLEFQENIKEATWTWPDGTNDSRPPEPKGWSVNYANLAIDMVSSRRDPIKRLFDGSRYVNFTYIVHVPKEYKDEDIGEWVTWLPNEIHPREYKGATQKARIVKISTNRANGRWLGPWQEESE